MGFLTTALALWLAFAGFAAPFCLAPRLALAAPAARAAAEPPLENDGLSVVLGTDSTAAPMGAPVVFHVSLAFDTTSAPPATRILDKYAGRCEFVFADERTGASFRRPPYDVGMLVMPLPGDIVHLEHGVRLPLKDMTVVTGYWLRECTGLEVVDQVRAVYPELPILIVSGGGWSWDLHIEAARRGAYCLSKVTPPEDFQDVLIDFIDAMLEFKEWKAGMRGKRRKAVRPLD